MIVARGDIVLVRFPFSSGSADKVRPALVVQSDRNNTRLTNVIVAGITTTLHRSNEATQKLISVETPAGRTTGLVYDSVVTCENLATLDQRLIQRKIGFLQPDLMADIDDCLKASLGIAV